MTFKLKERLIAYFDILGYKNAFLQEGFDSKIFLKTIKNAVKTTKQIFNCELNEKDFYVKVFSDNAIIIYDGDKSSGALILKLLLVDLQSIMLNKYGLLIRGSIAFGEIYADNNLVFGRGVIDCVELEGKAEYPRIIIQDSLKDLFIEDGFSFVEKGRDGFYEIIYLKAEDQEESEELNKNIKKLVRKNCSKNQSEKLIKKYIWLINTFNNYNVLEQIDYKLKYERGVLNGIIIFD